MGISAGIQRTSGVCKHFYSTVEEVRMTDGFSRLGALFISSTHPLLLSWTDYRIRWTFLPIFFSVFLFIPKRSYVGWDWILIITQTTGAPQLLRENITVSAALQVRRLAKRTSMLKSSPLLCAMEPNKINSLRYFFPNRWMKKKKFIQIEYEIFLSCMPSRGVRLEPSDNILSWEKKKPIITNFSIPDRFYSLCSNPSCPFYFSSLFQYMTQSITADEVKLGYIPKKKDICIDLTLCTSIGPFFFLLRYIFL